MLAVVVDDHDMGVTHVIRGDDHLNNADVYKRQPLITPFERQDSALLSILTEANALLIRPVNDDARRAGDLVEYIAI